MIPTDAIPESRFRRVVSDFLQRDGIVISWTLAIKVLLFLFGAVVYQVLENKPVLGLHGVLEVWNRWDALAYQRLAQTGYQMTGEFKTWFYPLMPWAIRLFAYVTGNYVVSAFVVSGIASIVAAILLHRLTRLDFTADVALRSVWFFLIFPTAYFLHVGYTESLFLSLALGSVFAARTDRWRLAGLLGAFSCMTRANGLVLVPTLAVEAAHQYFLQRQLRWQWLWIAIVPLGFSVYLLINWSVTGDPFAFLHLREKLFFATTAWPWVGVRDLIGHLNQEPSPAALIGTQELIFTALGFVGTIVAWIKLRPLYGMWMTGNWLLALSVSYAGSMPRYTLTLFPIFMLFALLAANRFWNAVITVWSILFLAFFGSLFAWGHWAF